MFVELRGERVNVVEFGRGERTIVGVSGAFGTWEIWQQPFELLSRNYRTIAYDHFGTGLTHVAAERVTFEEQVLLLEALLDAKGVERCVLVGDSNMVATAVEFAARRPERVEGLALVAGGVTHEADKLTMGFVGGLRANFEATLDGFVKFCIPEEDSAHLQEMLKGIIRRTGGERAAMLSEMFYGVDVSARLPELKMPVVIVQGEHDKIHTSNAATARAMAERIPGCELRIMPGVGHVPTLTRPAEVAEILEGLVERTGGNA